MSQGQIFRKYRSEVVAPFLNQLSPQNAIILYVNNDKVYNATVKNSKAKDVRWLKNKSVA